MSRDIGALQTASLGAPYDTGRDLGSVQGPLVVPTYDALLAETTAYFPLDEITTTTVAENRSGAQGVFTNIDPEVDTAAGLAPNSPAAITFDGVDQFVSGPADGLGDVDQTISAWVKTTDVSAYIVSTRDGAAGGLSIFIDSGGDLQLVVGSTAETTSGIAVDDDVAHHVAVAFNTADDAAFLYLDGVLVDTLTPTTGTWTASENILLGARGNTLPAILEPFAGTIDEVLVIPRELFWDEILRLFEDKPVRLSAYDQLKFESILHLPLDDLSGTNVANLVGTDATAVNMDLAVATTTGIGTDSSYAVTFDGVDESIQGPAVGLGDVDQSISAWVETTDISAYIVSTRDDTTGGLSIFIDSSGYLQLVVGSTAETTSSVTVNDGVKHHVVATFDAAADTAYLYLDNVLVDTLTPTTGTWTAGETVVVGARGDTLPAILEPFAGVIDEVMIFEKTLTTTEVADVFAMTSGLADLLSPRISYSVNLAMSKLVNSSQNV